MTTLQYDPVHGVRTITPAPGLKDAATVRSLPEDKGIPAIIWAARYRQRRWQFPEFRVFNTVGSLKQSNVWQGYSYGYDKQDPDQRAEFYVWFDNKWHRLYAKDIRNVTNKNVHVFLAKRKLQDLFSRLEGAPESRSVQEAISLLDTAT